MHTILLVLLVLLQVLAAFAQLLLHCLMKEQNERAWSHHSLLPAALSKCMVTVDLQNALPCAYA